MRKTILMPLIALGVLGPAVANADVIINSLTLDIHDSTYVVSGSGAGAYAQFQGETAHCSISIGAVDLAGGASCGKYQDFSALITVDVTQTGSSSPLIWQFGADWDNGGVLLDLPLGTVDAVYLGYRWWEQDWNNANVITFQTTGDVTFGLLGFDGCCGGGMSLRYSEDGGQTWEIASVPEPSTLALLGLGLAGIGFSRRNKV